MQVLVFNMFVEFYNNTYFKVTSNNFQV